ncbi:hypothetical protein [Paraflavitalea sp. CAU 1676]|uniref:hypothetical protein n=1 Tax=Paraflavitalea sp. CAU 1676 TaxID=3032598 RepID=UPI0023DB684B|nr:hypothetical protein [Paraflavitalea sp. CAU 1676]MDF2188005.1 hypothetical protein [Paraflavitalea sp. CAU 1676]
MNLIKEQKAIGAITILSGLLAFACMVASLIAVNFNFDALSDPMLILSTAGTNTAVAKWSMIFDMFGYYLLLLPIIYLLHDWMKDRSAWANLVTFCGIAYVLIGSIGASILAVVWPKLINAYHLANETEQQILKANFSLINDVVYGGLWNLLEMTFAATWWIFTGYQLRKNNFYYIGWLTMLTGISCLGDALAGILQAGWLHEASLNIYLALAIIWAISIGIFMMSKKLNKA